MATYLDKTGLTRVWGKITALVSSTLSTAEGYTDAALAALEIGGNNLVRNSTGNLGSADGWSGSGAPTVLGSSLWRVSDIPAQRFAPSGTSAWTCGNVSSQYRMLAAKAGDKFTLSGWWKVPTFGTSAWVGVRTRYDNNGTSTAKDYIAAQASGVINTWTRFEHTFTLQYDLIEGTTGGNLSGGPLVRMAGGGVIYLSELKLEKGEKATAWEPAPNDSVANTGVYSKVDGNATTVENNTVTNLAMVTLAPGAYVLKGTASFGSNASGYRQLGFGTSATSNNRDRYSISRLPPASGAATVLEVTTFVDTSSSLTLYLNGLQTSGGSLTVTGGIQVLRIK